MIKFEKAKQTGFGNFKVMIGIEMYLGIIQTITIFWVSKRIEDEVDYFKSLN